MMVRLTTMMVRLRLHCTERQNWVIEHCSLFCHSHQKAIRLDI